MRLFTGRGWLFLVSGLVLSATALIVGQRDVLRLGILLLVVPLLSAILLQVSPTTLRLRRQVQPGQVWPDTPASVQVQVLNPSTTWTRLMLATDDVPPALGPAPRFAIERLPPGSDLTVTYRLRGAARGVYQIGPLQYRVGDALGMVERRRTYRGTAELLVLPRVHHLAAADWGVTDRGQIDVGEAHVAPADEVDISTREYRHGDDLRRVHWRATARHGDLMVRREEQSQERLATVLLDAREEGHPGTGNGRRGAESSREWAISAAASACERLSSQGFAVRLVTDGVDHDWVWPQDLRGRDQQLIRLARLQPLPAHSLADAVELLAGQRNREFVVAVLGDVSPAQRALARIGPGFALFCVTETRTSRPPGRVPRLTVETPRLTVDIPGAADELRRMGWACASYHPGVGVVEAWRGLVETWKPRAG